MTTVLILGGLGGDSTRFLVPYLLGSFDDEETQAPVFVRVVDKYLCIIQADAYTTYVDSAVKAAFKAGSAAGKLEYVQGNLMTEATRTKAFTLPEKFGGPSKGFDIVFDFTGESGDAADAVHLELTLKQSLLLGQSAVAQKAGVFVKAVYPFYKIGKDGKDGQVGTGAVAEPWGTRAKWAHEAARGLSLIKGLKLIVLRPGFFYGGYSVTGVTPRVLIGECYKFQNEKIEFLWGETLEQSTIHWRDFASAAYAAAQWGVDTPDDKLAALAGEELTSTLSSDSQIKDVPGAAKKNDKVVAAVFTIADEGRTTMGHIANVISEVVGVEHGFYGSLVASFAKMNLGSVVQDANEKHLESWSELLLASNPPISTTIPISPHVPSDLLQPYHVSLSNAKLKGLTSWKPKYSLTSEVVKDTVAKFREEGHWPNAAALKK